MRRREFIALVGTTATAAGATLTTVPAFAPTVPATNRTGSGIGTATTQVNTAAAPVVLAGSFSIQLPLSSGQQVGIMTTGGSSPATSWAITAGNSSDYFAISNAGVITVTSAGSSNITTAGNYCLTCQASSRGALGLNTAAISVTNNQYADASANAPQGAPQYPHLLDVNSPRTQTYGMTYVTRPPWKVAGVDYYVGIDRAVYPTDAYLKDPYTIGTKIPGVAVSDNTVTITGNNAVLDGYDFSLGGGWVLQINSGDNATISNCKFIGTAGAPFQIPGANRSTATNTNVINCYFDGTNNNNIWEIIINGNGGAVFSYCRIMNNIGMVMGATNYAGTNNTTWDLTFKYCLIGNAGLNFASNKHHGDWIQIYGSTGPIRNFTMTFCTFIQDLNYPKSGTQGVSVKSAGSGVNYPLTGNSTFTYNTCITPYNPPTHTAYCNWHIIQDLGVGSGAPNGRIIGTAITQYNYADDSGNRLSAQGYRGSFAMVGVYNSSNRRGIGTVLYSNNIRLTDGSTIAHDGVG